jgi:hypothetical protein
MTGADGKTAFASMIVGRIIAGFGNAIISSSVPLYQRFVGLHRKLHTWTMVDQSCSEIAPAKKRGGLVVMNHIGMVTGLSAAFW